MSPLNYGTPVIYWNSKMALSSNTKRSYKDISDAIQTIKSALYLANESDNIPVKLINTWNEPRLEFNSWRNS
ncbi:MAG: hypothetical protein PHN45_02420 [Methylococcales bacterium]|nr:hypothetical protein [Methylococcales bacterium]